MSRVVLGNAEDSPFVNVARGKRFEIRFAEPFLYELDGVFTQRGERRLRVAVHPASITVCVPATPESRRAAANG